MYPNRTFRSCLLALSKYNGQKIMKHEQHTLFDLRQLGAKAIC